MDPREDNTFPILETPQIAFIDCTQHGKLQSVFMVSACTFQGTAVGMVGASSPSISADLYGRKFLGLKSELTANEISSLESLDSATLKANKTYYPAYSGTPVLGAIQSGVEYDSASLADFSVGDLISVDGESIIFVAEIVSKENAAGVNAAILSSNVSDPGLQPTLCSFVSASNSIEQISADVVLSSAFAANGNPQISETADLLADGTNQSAKWLSAGVFSNERILRSCNKAVVAYINATDSEAEFAKQLLSGSLNGQENLISLIPGQDWCLNPSDPQGNPFDIENLSGYCTYKNYYDNTVSPASAPLSIIQLDSTAPGYREISLQKDEVFVVVPVVAQP